MYRYEGSDFESMEEGFDIFTKPSRNASNYIFNDYIFPTEKLSLQDLVCHSLFQQIETRINNVPISVHARLYPFREISHCIYSFQTDSKKTLLQSEGFSEMSKGKKMRMWVKLQTVS